VLCGEMHWQLHSLTLKFSKTWYLTNINMTYTQVMCVTLMWPCVWAMFSSILVTLCMGHVQQHTCDLVYGPCSAAYLWPCVWAMFSSIHETMVIPSSLFVSLFKVMRTAKGRTRTMRTPYLIIIIISTVYISLNILSFISKEYFLNVFIITARFLLLAV